MRPFGKEHQRELPGWYTASAAGTQLRRFTGQCFGQEPSRITHRGRWLPVNAPRSRQAGNPDWWLTQRQVEHEEVAGSICFDCAHAGLLLEPAKHDCLSTGDVFTPPNRGSACAGFVAAPRAALNGKVVPAKSLREAKSERQKSKEPARRRRYERRTAKGKSRSLVHRKDGGLGMTVGTKGQAERSFASLRMTGKC
jgi:hypothetical protein